MADGPTAGAPATEAVRDETEDAEVAVRTFLEEGPRARPVFEGR